MRAARDGDAASLGLALQDAEAALLLGTVVHGDVERGFPWELTGDAIRVRVRGAYWLCLHLVTSWLRSVVHLVGT